MGTSLVFAFLPLVLPTNFFVVCSGMFGIFLLLTVDGTPHSTTRFVMSVDDRDWKCIQDWILHVTTDEIAHTSQHGFSTIVSQLARAHFYAPGGITPKHDYQAFVLACMYMVSCHACHHPISLQVLHTLCCGCYSTNKIVETLHAFIRWMHPSEIGVDYVKTLDSRNEGTQCDLVTIDSGHLMLVRKRIRHHGMLPSSEAMNEIIVHTILKPQSTTNIAALVHVHINNQHTDLFYEYVHTPLQRFFGTTDAIARHAIIVSLLRGVRCMHKSNIAHRDLKGSNIHVANSSQECMLLDVGSAGYGVKRCTIPVCTVTHRSPDILQAEMDRVCYWYEGTRLDIWSIGVLILEVYSGPEPFGPIPCDSTAAQMLSVIRTQKASALQKLRDSCTAVQMDIIAQCLDEIPENRPDIDDLLGVFS
jgi:hypothetical protein